MICGDDYTNDTHGCQEGNIKLTCSRIGFTGLSHGMTDLLCGRLVAPLALRL